MWEYVFALIPVILFFVFTPIGCALIPETNDINETDTEIRKILFETYETQMEKVFYLQWEACDLDQSVSCLNQLFFSKIIVLILTIPILLIYVSLVLLFFKAATGVDVRTATNVISVTFMTYPFFSTLFLDNPLHARLVLDLFRINIAVIPAEVDNAENAPPIHLNYLSVRNHCLVSILTL